MYTATNAQTAKLKKDKEASTYENSRLKTLNLRARKNKYISATSDTNIYSASRGSRDVAKFFARITAKFLFMSLNKSSQTETALIRQLSDS